MKKWHYFDHCLVLFIHSALAAKGSVVEIMEMRNNGKLWHLTVLLC